MKVFQSHVGWGPGQLERFLEDGPWRILPATAEHVFSVGTNLWEVVQAICGEQPAEPVIRIEVVGEILLVDLPILAVSGSSRYGRQGGFPYEIHVGRACSD